MAAHHPAIHAPAHLLAVDGVFGEPVSGSNSLLTGKNTGNFRNYGTKIWPAIRLSG
jgi:hypothetical protein